METNTMSFNERETLRISAFRVSEAKKTKGRLLAWAEAEKPPLVTFVKELSAAGFDYSHDDRNAAVYVCEGVEIRAFGGAINPPEANGKRFTANLNREQLMAKSRREELARNRAHAPETAADRAKRESDRVARRLERQSAQPKKGFGGSTDPHGKGKDKGDKKNGKKK